MRGMKESVVMGQPFLRSRGTPRACLSLLAFIIVALGVVSVEVATAPSALGSSDLTEVSVRARGIIQPRDIAVGSDGALWFTNDGAIGRVTPAGSVTMFEDSFLWPQSITAGPDGALWIVDYHQIKRLTTAGAVSEFGFGWDPGAITSGPDGALWFTSSKDGGSIGRISTSGVVTTYPDPALSGVREITAGPDGALWFTIGAASVGRITTTGAITTYTDPGILDPQGLAAGPDGALWFTNSGWDVHSVGRISTAGVVTTFTDGSVWYPRGITAGPDGALWFANGGSGPIGRITTSGVVSTFGSAEGPESITAGPDGALWFTDRAADSIGRVTTSGVVSTFRYPDVARPTAVVAGPDSASWFTDSATNEVKRISMNGVVSSFGDATVSDPQDITLGPDGALWFTNSGNDTIGRITTAGVISNFSDAGIGSPSFIVSGPDGALWFVNHGSDPIGRITTSGALTFFSDPGISRAQGIASGPDGALWVTNRGYEHHWVARLTTLGTVSTYEAPGIFYPGSITAGADGALWFTTYGNGIGRITTAGEVTFFESDSNSGTTVDTQIDSRITSGPDGALWFTEDYAIGRVTPSGSISKFVAQNGTDYGAISPGPDGAVWFTARGMVGSVGPPPPPAPQGSGFRAVTPFRLVDSRPGPAGKGFVGPVGAGQAGVKSVQVAGVGSVPVGASAVVMNVTVTGGTSSSYLSVFPGGGEVPPTASLLFGVGQTVPNQVTVKVGGTGAVSFFNQQGTVHVVADVLGYYDGDGSGDRFFGVTPTRLYDSRLVGGALGEGEVRDVVVRGSGPVPNAASALVANVTVTAGSTASYLQAFPSGDTQPVTANVLFAKGQSVPNLVTVGIGADGKVSLFNQLGNVDVIVDVVGYFAPGPGGSVFQAENPIRILDSRNVGVGAWTGAKLGANESRLLGIGAPPISGLVANVTVTGGTSASYVAVSPTPGPVPAPTANLLFGAGQTVPNAVMVGLGAGGGVDVYNQQGSVHVIIDAAGFFVGA